MTEQLYIDGQLVDMPKAGIGISLNINSNILTNFGVPVGNYTNTIKLPMTSRNAEIFGVRGEVAVVNDIPYDVHEARFIRNGVEMISAGKCYLLSVSDSYEVSICWRRDNLGALINSADTLDMLGDQSAVVMTGEQQESTPASDITDTPIFAWYDGSTESEGFRKPQDISKHPFQPSITVDDIIAAIETRYGVQFNIGGDTSGWCIPITGRTAPAGTIQGGIYVWLGLGGYEVGKSSRLTNWTQVDSGTPCTDIVKATADGDGTAKALKTTVPLKLRVRSRYVNGIDFYLRYTGSSTNITPPDGFELIACKPANNKDWSGEKIATICDTWTVTSDNLIHMEFDTSFDVESGQLITFAFRCEDTILYEVVANSASTGAESIILDSPYEVAEAPLNRAIYVWRNLPKVKVLDFIYTLCAFTGTYCAIDGSMINLYSYDELASRPAIDKTADLILASRMMKPKNIAFKVNGWEAVNLLQWANGYEGEIDVNNAQLTGSRDWFKSVFNATEGAAGWILRCWAENWDDYYTQCTYDYDTPSPTIAKAVAFQGAQTQRLRLSRVDFSDIVAAKYASVQSWLDAVVVVKATMARGEDLLTAEKIYIAQFGAYFTPLTIQMDGKSDIANVELLKIS